MVNVFFFPFYDVDTYHDGFIYPMALISSNGGVPNKSYFSMYGPIGPSIQGLWLQVFGESLWILRLHGAILILVIAWFIYRILSFKVMTTTAILLSSGWLVGNPLIVQPSLPWVDLYTSGILLIGILYIIKYKWLTNQQLFLLGIFFSLGIFAKVNFAIPLFGILMVVILIYGFKGGFVFSIGSLVTTLSVICTMFINGNIMDYLNQGIIFPLTMHDDGKSLRGLINIKILGFGLMLTIILKVWQRVPQSRKENNWFKTWLPIFLCIVAVILTFNFRKLDEPFLSLLNLNAKEGIYSLLKNLPYALMYSAIFILWIKGLKVLQSTLFSTNKDPSHLILGISICSTLQLYPNPEPAHIWYILPVVIVGIFYNYLDKPFEESNQEFLKKLLLIPTCLSLITINVIYVSQERINHTVVPLRQMKSAPDVVNSVDGTLRKLSLFTKGKSVQFNCPLGIYSVANNIYRGSDNQYVDLIPRYGVAKTKSDLIFECDLSKNEIEAIVSAKEVLFVSSGYGQYGDNVLYRTPK